MKVGGTMARYELVAKDRTSDKWYVIKLRNQKTNQTKEKNDLFEIDAVTSIHKSEEELKQYIYERGCIANNNVDFRIRYVSNHEYKCLNVYVNEPLIARTSVSLIRKKDKNQKTKVDFNPSEMRLFYANVLYCMRDKEISKLLSQNKYDLVPYMIREKYLSDYLELWQKEYRTESENFNIRKIESSVGKELSNYKNFRELFLWFKLYNQGKIRLTISAELNHHYKQRAISNYYESEENNAKKR